MLGENSLLGPVNNADEGVAAVGESRTEWPDCELGWVHVPVPVSLAYAVT